MFNTWSIKIELPRLFCVINVFQLLKWSFYIPSSKSRKEEILKVKKISWSVCWYKKWLKKWLFQFGEKWHGFLRKINGLCSKIWTEARFLHLVDKRVIIFGRKKKWSVPFKVLHRFQKLDMWKSSTLCFKKCTLSIMI